MISCAARSLPYKPSQRQNSWSALVSYTRAVSDGVEQEPPRPSVAALLAEIDQKCRDHCASDLGDLEYYRELLSFHPNAIAILCGEIMEGQNNDKHKLPGSKLPLIEAAIETVGLDSGHVGEHIATCTNCRKQFEELRSLMSGLSLLLYRPCPAIWLLRPICLSNEGHPAVLDRYLVSESMRNVRI